MVRTSTAAANGYVCPRCGDRLNRDRSGKGFVSHATNPNCTFEQGEKDDFRIWRSVHNDDNGSLITGDVKLPEGAVIRIRGEDQDRTVNYVMGSDRNGWRACTAGHGAVPTGDIEWQIISLGPNDPDRPPTPPPPAKRPNRVKHKWFDFHTWKGVAEFVAALLTIIGFISAFIAWAFFGGK
jgi:hypothetical protein